MIDNHLRYPGVFPPESLSSLHRAYAAALESLPAEASSNLRLDLAVRIMRLALDGEGDETRLTSQALAAVLTSDARRPHAADHVARSAMK